MSVAVAKLTADNQILAVVLVYFASKLKLSSGKLLNKNLKILT